GEGGTGRRGEAGTARVLCRGALPVSPSLSLPVPWSPRHNFILHPLTDVALHVRPGYALARQRHFPRTGFRTETTRLKPLARANPCQKLKGRKVPCHRTAITSGSTFLKRATATSAPCSAARARASPT